MAAKYEVPQIGKFDGKNYQIWKFQLELILCQQDLMTVVNGIETKPVPSSENDNAGKTALLAWIKKDNKARVIISTSMEYKQLEQLVNCSTSSEMWVRLKAVHEQKSESSLLQLQQEYFSYKMQDGDAMASHIARVENLARQLKSIGENISCNQIMAKMINSLTEKYANFVMAWESVSRDERTLDNLTARLMSAEKRFMESDVKTANALSVSTKKPVHLNQSQENKFRGNCHFCKKFGHIARNCYLKKKANIKSGAIPSSKQVKHGSQKRSTALNMTMVSSELLKLHDVWVKDSGATDHMSYRRNWFSTFHEIEGGLAVRVGDKREIIATGRGNIEIQSFVNGIWEDVTLTNVLYLPDLGKNLFSEGAATDNGGRFETTNTETKCYVNNRLVACGLRNDSGLYKMLFRVNNLPEANLASSGSLQLWHERLGHINVDTIKLMAKEKLVDGLVLNEEENFFCEDCLYGKQHRSSFKTVNDKQQFLVGEYIHSDVCGPMSKSSVGGARYFVLFKDDCSGYRVVNFIKFKSEVFKCFRDFCALVKTQTGRQVKVLRSDNGLEYVNNEFSEFLETNGIRHERSTPYSPEQNGRAERDMRTIVESARTMINAADIDLELWAEATNTAVYILNRTTSKQAGNSTPYELWTGRKADLGHIRLFGCDAFIHIPKQRRSKWDRKSQKMILVGYEKSSKNYRLWNPETRQIEISCNVIFKEKQTFSDTKDLLNNNNEPEKLNGCEESPSLEMDVRYTSQIIGKNSASTDEDDVVKTERVILQKKPFIPSNIQTRSMTKSSVTKTKYDSQNGHVKYACIAELDAPGSYEEAMTSGNSGSWTEAMEEEMNALKRNETWIEVERPNDQKVIGCKWVYRIKQKQSGEVCRFKARLVAKGYAQRAGIDYQETFAPVVRYDSVRVLLALAASNDMEIAQFDVKTAFLYGELKEDIFLEQPEGFKTEPNLVLKLKKSLYGLKQSPRVWNERFSKFLKTFKLKQSDSDNCVFYGKVSGNDVWLAIYVDDGLIFSKSLQTLNTVLDKLSNEFDITILPADYFVGLEITRNRDEKSIKVSQKAYIERILNRFNMNDCKTVETPADVNQQLSKVEESFEEQKLEVPYREVIGSLMFAAIVSRPDISFIVNKLSQFLNNPSQVHWTAVKRVLRYLKGTINYGITYDGSNESNLVGFSDADYAGDLDTRRSTSGYVFLISEGAVTWTSQRQATVALSTTEAEYIAACLAAKEAIWLRRIVNELSPRRFLQ